MSIRPGDVVDGYRIERVLGVGGMGSVYLARHPELPRYDALKVLSAQYSRDPNYRARFEREANLAAALDHPNIVSIYTRGESQGQLWIAMQYVSGVDAANEQARSPQTMTPQRALRIVSEIGRGLDHAHRRGMLHRDIKPANFLLSASDDDDERVLLTDFGVAKSTDDTTEITQAGGLVATIAYASPEQLSGHRLDHRTDIYSLACSFFRLATGQNPYPGTQPAPVMVGHLHGPLPRASTVNPALPPGVDHVLAMAMAKDPTARFDNCHDFTSALKSALEHSTSSFDERTIPQRAPSLAPGLPTGRGATWTSPLTASRPIASVPKRLWICIATVTAVAAAAVGIGIWSRVDNTHGNADTAASATLSGPKSIDQARAQNPAFEGKRIVLVDAPSSTLDNPNASLSVQLSPGLQSDFLEKLGFRYNSDFQRDGDEPSPRPITSEATAKLLRGINSGYLLVARSDTKAGGGSLVNLPDFLLSSKATIIVLDDPVAVTALRQWSGTSEGILLEKLVPVLSRSVK
ncbi:serine/threonine-protein kinase [Nocardia sp. NPDC057668]|uniref:serine/threonine-protein kinase n=1 Tax=Nocardia sp. NPDC057668 TaxID=3346202 RepID=UPI00366EF551